MTIFPINSPMWESSALRECGLDRVSQRFAECAQALTRNRHTSRTQNGRSVSSARPHARSAGSFAGSGRLSTSRACTAASRSWYNRIGLPLTTRPGSAASPVPPLPAILATPLWTSAFGIQPNTGGGGQPSSSATTIPARNAASAAEPSTRTTSSRSRSFLNYGSMSATDAHYASNATGPQILTAPRHGVDSYLGSGLGF